MKLIGHSSSILSICYSPDGRTLASAGIDQFVWLWDLQLGKVRSHLTGHKGFVSSVRFSPNGRFVASGGGDQRIKIWDAHFCTEVVEIS